MQGNGSLPISQMGSQRPWRSWGPYRQKSRAHPRHHPSRPGKVDGDSERSPQEGLTSSLGPLPCLPGHRLCLEKDRAQVRWEEVCEVGAASAGKQKGQRPGAAGQSPRWETPASRAWMHSDLELWGARGNRGHQVNSKLRKLIIFLV